MFPASQANAGQWLHPVLSLHVDSSAPRTIGLCFLSHPQERQNWLCPPIPRGGPQFWRDAQAPGSSEHKWSAHVGSLCWEDNSRLRLTAHSTGTPDAGKVCVPGPCRALPKPPAGGTRACWKCLSLNQSRQVPNASRCQTLF